jgi:acyl-CoA dehydrogenase
VTPGEAGASGPFRVEDEAEIRDAVRSLCQRFGDGYWRTQDAAMEFPWEFYAALAEAGWIGIAMPEEYGGGGRGITEAAIVLEEIAASGAAMNGCSAVHLSIFGMNPVVKHGSPELRARYLPRVATGELHVAFGVTEPDAGTDTTAITTFARPVAGGYLVRGRKVWTSKALHCQKVLLLVRTASLESSTRRSDGMTLLLADLQRPEVDIRPIAKTGRNAVVSCEVRFVDLFVAEDDRVGEEGAGFTYLLDGLNPERILVAAEALGIGKAAIRRAVAYAGSRVVFGRPIGANQGISFPLADAHLRLHAAELAIRTAGWRYDRGLPCGEAANAAKYLAAEAGYLAADRAVQTHGGMGYALEYDVERYWREARLMRIAPVTQEMVLNYVAEHVLRLPRSY